jgi:hypothetical protein
MPDEEKPLSPETKEAINSYLVKLSAIIGIPNLVFVAGAFIYILFFLPSQAVQQARALMEQQMANVIQATLSSFTPVMQAANKSSLDAVLQAGKAQNVSDQAIRRAGRMEEELIKLEGRVKTLSQNDRIWIDDIIQTLKKNPEVTQTLELIKRVDTLDKTLNALQSMPRIVTSAIIENGKDCSEKKELLGSYPQFRFCALAMSRPYRHGINKGHVSCQVIFEETQWTLVATGASQMCGNEGGATSIACQAVCWQ